MIDVTPILEALTPLENEENSATIIELKNHLNAIAEEGKKDEESIKALQANNNKLVTMLSSGSSDNNPLENPEEPINTKTTDDYLKSIFSSKYMSH